MQDRDSIIKKIVRRLLTADWKTIWFIYYYLEAETI